MSKIFCTRPFEHVEINSSGDVYLCPDCVCSYFSVGNILQNDFNEIINGDRANDFRNQFTKQEFPYCQFDQCQVPTQCSDEEFDKKINEIKDKGPKFLQLTYDQNCNLLCIFCEHKVTKDLSYRETETARQIQEKVKEILPLLDKNHGYISLNFGGEVFTSKLLLELIGFATQNYPNIKFQLITNGILCSESMLKKYGLIDKIENITVSVHAASEKTYNRIVKGGNFKVLRKNLEFLSKLKKEGRIKTFILNFVVISENYKELESFAKWAFSLGACVDFLPIRKLVENADVFDSLNISDKNHPKHKDFVKFAEKFLKNYDKYSLDAIDGNSNFAENTKRFLNPPVDFVSEKKNFFSSLLDRLNL